MGMYLYILPALIRGGKFDELSVANGRIFIP